VTVRATTLILTTMVTVLLMRLTHFLCRQVNGWIPTVTALATTPTTMMMVMG